MPHSSLLISHYNDTDGLKKCVESIASSTDSDFEILVYDDGSDDGHKNQLEDLIKRDSRIRCIFGELNRGCGYGFDLLSKEASGHIVHYVGADDLVHPMRVIEARDFHDTHRISRSEKGSVPILATGYRHLDHAYKLLPQVAARQLCHEHIHAAMYFYTPIAHGTVSILRSGYERLSPFPIDRRAGVDYLFFCRNNEMLTYHYTDKSRYYIRLKQKSLTRTPSTRKEQLESHDLAMHYLWNQNVGDINLEDIRSIRRLCVSADDMPSQSAMVDRIKQQRLCALMDELERSRLTSKQLASLIDYFRDRIMRSTCRTHDAFTENTWTQSFTI